MNRVEMNEEMLEAVAGGREYNVGDHVEVKNLIFWGTSGATITFVGTTENNKRVYRVKYDHSYDALFTNSQYLYSEDEFEN